MSPEIIWSCILLITFGVIKTPPRMMAYYAHLFRVAKLLVKAFVRAKVLRIVAGSRTTWLTYDGEERYVYIGVTAEQWEEAQEAQAQNKTEESSKQ